MSNEKETTNKEIPAETEENNGEGDDAVIKEDELGVQDKIVPDMPDNDALEIDPETLGLPGEILEGGDIKEEEDEE